MSLSARTITPMQVVEDMDAAAEAFAALGFQPVSQAGDCPCTGWQAENGSAVVVMPRALIAREFGEDVAAQVASRALSYVTVECLPDAIEELGPAGRVLARAVTSYGTLEAVVETAGGPMILAERVEG
ncbi:MAG: hypothetical protein AB7E80_04565 [Hyphomicrobiaceae bacterium]